jgi:hypothetical protein
MADGEADEILAKVVAKARGGDLKAAELVLARVWPARKGRRVSLDLPTVDTAQDIAIAVSAVLEATKNGEITPDEAAVIASVLEIKRKALETLELEQRIEKLESRTK